MGVHVCVCRAEVNVKCVLLSLSTDFKERVSHWSGVHQLSHISWPESPRNCPAMAGVYRHMLPCPALIWMQKKHFTAWASYFSAYEVYKGIAMIKMKTIATCNVHLWYKGWEGVNEMAVARVLCSERSQQTYILQSGSMPVARCGYTDSATTRVQLKQSLSL